MIANQSLQPKAYYESSTFDSERVDVFENNWIFAGFEEQLTNDNDFITLTIGNTPVVVQNFKGQLSALLNVCSHRRAQLQSEPQGNRPLRCPYHCWSFKRDGALASVPQNNTDFKLTQDDKKRLSLRQFDLALCGSFVFVRVSKNGPTLAEFLGPYFSILKELSANFCDSVGKGSYDWQTNWKIACETVLEVYHVAGVHPETFAKFAKAECEIQFFNGHSTGNTPLQNAPKKWWEGAREYLKIKQNQEYTEYNHFFIYPNLAIGLTNGTLMSLQTYEPIGPTRSKLNFNLKMVQRTDGKKTSEAVKAAIMANFNEFNHTILEEDRVVAESCQKSMLSVDTPGVLGKCEDRILHFHSAWKQDINQDSIQVREDS
ncbi:aromatic ring-hydroxylating dioxygenase subunit alpha [Alteromonas sp. 5E99-2]|uniref:aromatic ring-hydroxylating oxygenase subunit alpha n=1 Tax=Alteromonas sp. 5E99-2 TaxID=2817683 RepID=UPI001A97FD1B|nr:aromatic ring-hydroxylating dioxygenase subunit alpha [Alteromonas sp. 5E99-2]MBO1256005.1 aromatic ring-hydroxylating dioxygenase subunit alpha [Alteromonas sp. 5E99-2]